jgi:hypothetical protein
LSYALLFKRKALLSYVFPDGEAKEISIPDELKALSSSAFWLRLYGLYVFLSSGMELLNRFVMEIISSADKVRSLASLHQNRMETLGYLVAMLMAFLLFSKARLLAKYLDKLGNDKAPHKPSNE